MTDTKITVRGNHFDDVDHDTKKLEWIGGAGTLQAARSLMDQLEPCLPTCPFCGAPTVLESRWAYSNPAVQALCTKCRSSSQLQVAGMNPFTRKEVSLSACIIRAANLWRRRAS